MVSALAGPPDTLTLGIPLEPPGLDPTAGAASAIREVTYANIFQGLTRIDQTGAVKPDLAKSWTISPDGLTYSFTLQSGVTFQDGTPFDCSIVQFSYARASAPDSINAQKQLFAPIAKVACPTPGEAVVTLKQPASTFLYDMAWGDAIMVAPKTAGTNKTHPVGTGPFSFSRWVPGDRIELVRNPHYWGPAPKLAAVTFRIIGDPAAATAALLSGSLDAYPDFPAPETVPKFQHDPRFTVDIGTTEGKVIMALDNTRKPFNDVRVRRALAYALDRKAIIEAAYSGLGTPIGSHYTPGDPGYVDLSNTYPYDPAKAKALLQAAGCRARHDLHHHLAAAELCAAQWRTHRRLPSAGGAEREAGIRRMGQVADAGLHPVGFRRDGDRAYGIPRPRYLCASALLLQLRQPGL